MPGTTAPDDSRGSGSSTRHSHGTRPHSSHDQLGTSKSGKGLSESPPYSHGGKTRTNLWFRRRPIMNWASVMTIWKRFRVIFVIVGLLCIILGVWGQGHREENEALFKLGAADMDVESAVRKAIQPFEQRLDAIEKQTIRKYPEVAYLPESTRMRILITGGAGFVGSHLADRLMLQGHEITVVDNFFTGRKRNIEHWIGHPNFELINHDVVNSLMIEGT
eukprot:XP_011667539.1 PREDICTED: UDP-glucuronic acid decarboxylase 1 [Strongylocentrotus purpuratus]